MAVGSLSGGGRGSGRRRRGKNVCQTAGQSKKLIRMPSGSECTRATLFFSCTAGAGAMSKELSRSVAFNNISSWDTEEVLKLLRKVSVIKKSLLRRGDDNVPIVFVILHDTPRAVFTCEMMRRTSLNV